MSLDAAPARERDADAPVSTIASDAPRGLADCVRDSVRRYLADLDDCQAEDLYAIVVAEVERPLLSEVMAHCQGNQSRAAQALGINRATLRKKLRQHGLG